MNAATLKWIIIFADIIAYEFRHRDDGMLLSQQCHRWVEAHPVLARVVFGIFGFLLTSHLGRLMPEKYDVWRKTLWSGVITHVVDISGRRFKGR